MLNRDPAFLLHQHQRQKEIIKQNHDRINEAIILTTKTEEDNSKPILIDDEDLDL
jgi:hypothetical protein